MRGRKKTMLLTVIAVATLLVAVVGATFAYFSLSVSGSGSTTVTANAAKVPIITMATTGSSFGVSVTAEDMAKPGNDGKSMWGIVDHEGEDNKSSDNIVGWWTDKAQKISILKVTSSTGKEDEKYECPIKITATLTGTMKEHLTSGDAKLHLYGPSDGSVKILSETLSETGKDYDLSTWKGAGSETINLTVQLIGNDESGKEIKADLEFINKITPQNDLAGNELSLVLTSASGGECKLVPAE